MMHVEMIEIETAVLKGEALNWAVAKVRGYTFKLSSIGAIHAYNDCLFVGGFVTKTERGMSMPDRPYSPSSIWSQGGPLQPLYHVQVAEQTLNGRYDDSNTSWSAAVTALPVRSIEDITRFGCSGDTLLQAVCRAIVAANLGKTVMVPVVLI